MRKNRRSRLNRILTAALLSVLSACGGGGGDGSGDASGQLSGQCELKVVNGEACPPGGGPIAMLVGFDGSGNPDTLCSGTFIKRDKILTAAHCRELQARGPVFAYTGAEKVRVTSLAFDPRYRDSGPNGAFDTAVVTLERQVDVTPLPLLISTHPTPGDTVLVYGYGTDESGETGIDHGFGNGVRRTEMRVDAYEDGIFTAKFVTTDSGACFGDSGGPAIFRNRDGLFGVAANTIGVARGSMCGGDAVDVFSGVRTPGSLDFIRTQAPGVGEI